MVREHDPLGRDVELFRRHLYSPGKPGPTSKGYRGAELVDGLVIKEGDYKLVKTRFSAFFATHLHSLLQSNGIDCLVIAGEFQQFLSVLVMAMTCCSYQLPLVLSGDLWKIRTD